MKKFSQLNQKGSIVMVALCFTVILGIALASYLAVTNQAMKLSHRSYLKSVSKNLAEMGLEQALWACNRNNWDYAGWTFAIDATTHQAIATLTTTFPNTTYGNGITGTVNVRVENYDALSPPVLNPKGEWSSTVSYVQDDIVSYSKISQWDAGAQYNVNDVVSLSAGGRYRCIQAHSTPQTPVLNSSTTYWVFFSEFSDFRRWYKCNNNHGNHPPPDAHYWNNYVPTIYAEGIATPNTSDQPIRTQLKGLVSIGPLFPNATGVTNKLILNGPSIVDSYNSSTEPPPPSGNPGYSAVLASTGTSNPAVEVDAATIQGYVTAPFSLTQFGGSASLKNQTGPVIAPNATAPNIDLARVSRSPYVPRFFPSIWYDSTGFGLNDVTRSGTNGNMYISKKIPNIGHDPLSGGGYWQNQLIDRVTLVSSPIGNPPVGSVDGDPVAYTFVGSLDLIAGETITIQGPVILDIQGHLSISDTGNIHIKNHGSAEIYFTSFLSVGNFSGPQHAATGFTYDSAPPNPDPKRLILVEITPSLPNKFWATSPFYGTIYMPDPTTRLLSIFSDIYGAVSAKSVTYPSILPDSTPGAANLHYDTSLRTASYHSIDLLYVLTEWRELTDPAEQITFP